MNELSLTGATFVLLSDFLPRLYFSVSTSPRHIQHSLCSSRASYFHYSRRMLMRFHCRNFVRQSLALNSATTDFSSPARLPANRCLSDANSSSSSPRTAFDNAEDIRRELKIVFQDVVRDVMELGREMHPEMSERYGKFLHYLLSGRGKRNRSVLLIESYHHFTRHSPPSDKNLKLAYVMACCVEMMNIFACLVDDLQNGRRYRFGQLCWHYLEGEPANNDTVLLESAMYATLWKHFRDKTYFTAVLEMFHRSIGILAMGQCLDMLVMKRFLDTRNLEHFTMDTYRTIVKHKTADSTDIFPVALSMRMAGITDEEMCQRIRDIFYEIGVIFSNQGDYSNCIGNPTVMGKDDDDIASGKCTWLIASASARADAQQKAILKECYGTPDEDKIEKVKKVYEEMRLPELFAVHQAETYRQLVTRIESLPDHYPREAMLNNLNSLYVHSRSRTKNPLIADSSVIGTS